MKFKNALQSLKEKTIGKSPGKKIKLSNKRVIGAAVVAFVTVLTVVLIHPERTNALKRIEEKTSKTYYKNSANNMYELLICGTILHDIGKLRELTTDEIGVSDYTIEGRLIGHIVLADEMILEKVFLAKQEGHPYPSEKVSMLRHMILSHHGTTEWGSPVAPAILEAEVLHQIDYMDSRLIQYTDA